MASAIAVERPPTIEYPSSDGQPMAETGIHVRAIELLHQALEDFFRGRPDVFIAADMYWYWKEGDNDAKHAPDVMVVPGVGNRDRRSFFSWEEGGAVPAAVFEMASQGTWKKDEDEKYQMYEALGVREYFLFDPEALYLSTPLKGYRLNGTAYRRLHPREGLIDSELGFRLRPEGTMLRLIDGATGNPIPTRTEWAERAVRMAEQAERVAVQAERLAAQEKARADALQAEVERLKRLIGGENPPNGNGS